MKKPSSMKAHGGELKNLVVDQERATTLKELAFSLPDITLSDHHLCDLELIATGAFSPIDGFMTQADYESVLDRMRLQDNTLWPIPICLDISKKKATNLEAGQSVALRDPEGFLLAVMHIEDIWCPDKHREAQSIYLTDKTTHSGTYHLFNEVNEYYIGGKIEVISLPVHYDFKFLRKTPSEIRKECQKLGWNRLVGYQTGTIIHRPQFEITIEAMKAAKANLLLLPIVGVLRTEDFDYYTRVRCLKEVMHNYPPDSHILSLLPHFMRPAGPREGILNAIIAKNYGCSHFVLCHDHADPYTGDGDECVYDNKYSQGLYLECQEDLEISLQHFGEMVYLPFEDEHKLKVDVADDVNTLKLTSLGIRERVRTGRNIPGWASFPEVLSELQKAYPGPFKQGFTVFCTGLSGAGKSTIARVLYSKMLEIGNRPVTLLDGDVVRHNLSSELSFSKEHRDINVRRIGFVASKITKNRGVAICAPIAPYQRTRTEIRKIIESYGGFIEVYVSTPLEECENRDRKGLYAKARAGLIKGYTGIDDPYEIPEAPELSINTTDITPDEAAQEVLLFLEQKGYI